MPELLTKKEIEEKRLEASLSPIFFASQCSILDPVKKRKIPFNLWPFQVDLLNDFVEHDLLVILKARQLGITWLALTFGLWHALTFEGANVLLISFKDDVSVALLDRVKFLYHSLPWWLQLTPSKDNTSTLAFGALNSKIEAYPSVSASGRGETATLVICDEWALHPFAEENFLSYKPTIDGGGKMIGISTANGMGGFFHSQYIAAKEGLSGFHPIFLPWRLHPDRDETWYEKKKKEYSATKNLSALFYQEFPGDDVEAFVVQATCVFEPELIQRMMKECKPPFKKEGNLRIWKHPIAGKPYVLGVDVAEGIGQNLSGIAVLDTQTGEHVADYHGDIAPDALAREIARVGGLYNNGLVGVERNNHGHTVLNVLKNYIGYENLYEHKDYDRLYKSGDQRLGWPTTSVTKPQMKDDFAAACRDNDFVTYDADLVREMSTFVPLGNDGYGALPGCMDDRVIKNMIAWQMKKHAYLMPRAPARYVIGGGI